MKRKWKKRETQPPRSKTNFSEKQEFNKNWKIYFAMASEAVDRWPDGRGNHRPDNGPM